MLHSIKLILKCYLDTFSFIIYTYFGTELKSVVWTLNDWSLVNTGSFIKLSICTHKHKKITFVPVEITNYTVDIYLFSFMVLSRNYLSSVFSEILICIAVLAIFLQAVHIYLSYIFSCHILCQFEVICPLLHCLYLDSLSCGVLFCSF